MSFDNTLDEIVSFLGRKVIAPITLAVGLAACAGKGYQPTAPGKQDVRKLTHQQIVTLEDRYAAMNSDGKRSRSEMSEIVSTYQMLKNAVLADGTPGYVRDDLAAMKDIYTRAVEELFDNTDFYMVMTGVDTKDFQNVPGNVGAVAPLYVGNGAFIRDKLTTFGDQLTFAQREALVLKATDKWQSHKVTQGSVQEGGGRVVGLDEAAEEITKEIAGRLVGDGLPAVQPGYKHVTNDEWAAYIDGKWDNGEMSKFFLTSVRPAEYAVSK